MTPETPLIYTPASCYTGKWQSKARATCVGETEHNYCLQRMQWTLGAGRDVGGRRFKCRSQLLRAVLAVLQPGH